MNEVILTENLSKHYHEVEAVSNVSLRVKKGEVYGFLGLNGAGKTTTIRMLLGMIMPSGGSAFINGTRIRPGVNSVWRNTGHLVEIPYAWPDLTVRENLEIIRKMRGIRDRTASDAIMTKLKLSQYAKRKAKHLSLGNAQRLGLAKALIHQPSVLILDEPTNGLDPAGIFEIRELLERLARSEGVTVFISSHILGEISKLADRIGIINEGRLIKELSTVELAELCQKQLKISTTDNEAAAAFLRNKNISFEFGERNELIISRNEYLDHPEKISMLLCSGNLPPVRLVVEEEDLESYFLRTIRINQEAI